LGLTLGSTTAPAAADITCGAVLGPGGHYRLEHDLTCVSHAFTVDSAHVDLQGHTVSCPGPIGFRCIVLTGAGASLCCGTATGGEHETLTLEGTGRHTVWDVTSTLIDTNVVITSDHNRLSNVNAGSSVHAAFRITGHHNRLTRSQALCPFLAADGCLSVAGDDNDLIDNLVTVEEDALQDHGGLRVSGNRNRLWLNRVTNADGTGIVVLGTGNVLWLNTAQGNGLDLRDANGDCTHNTWKHNTAGTVDPPCIGGGGALAPVAAK
jgi:hypothetical protein